MTTIVIDERSIEARKMVEFLKTQKFATVFKNKNIDISETEEIPYNPEFVKKILRGRASKGKAIKLEDLWK